MSELVRCAVMGDPIDHSLSPEIHQNFAAQFGMQLRYDKIRVSKEDFAKQVAGFFQSGGVGLNITLPLKELAFELADTELPAAKSAKAANTLWMTKEGLMADNTDGAGLVTDIKRYQRLVNKHVHILGAGGAARGVIQPLLDSGVQRISLRNRTHAKAEQLAKDFPQISIEAWDEPLKSIDILINATSVSLSKNSMIWPNIPPSVALGYDLAYQRVQPTPFIHYCQSNGIRAVDGLGMLIEQAALSFERWHHQSPDTTQIRTKLIRQPLF